MKSRNTISVISLIVGAGAMKMAHFISMPFLAIFLSQKTDLSFTSIGLIIALSPLSALLGSIIGGSLSDKMGRKLILVSSLIAITIIFFGFYSASSIENVTLQILMFSVLNGLNGFFSWMYMPVSQACLSDLVSEKDRSKIFHIRYTAINVGATLGPLIGLWLGINSSGSAFLFTGLFYLFFSVYLIVFLDPPNIPSNEKDNKIEMKNIKSALSKDIKLKYMLLGGVFFMCCYAQLEASLSQHLITYFPDGVTLFALLLTINGISILALQAPAYYLIRKIKSHQALMLGCIFFSIGILGIGLITPNHSYNMIMLATAMVIISIGEIFIFPVAVTVIDEIAPDSLRGSYFGAYALRQLGLCIGPPLGGFFLSSTSQGTLFYFTAVLVMIAGLVFWVAAKPLLIQKQKIRVT